MFSQSSLQPQVLTALSQLTSLLSTHRICASSFSTSNVQRTKLKEKKSTRGQSKSSEEVSYKVTQEVNIFENLPKDLTVAELCPLLSEHATQNGRTCSKPWKESFVSTQTFFENKTGFPESQLLCENKLPVSSLNKDFHRFLSATVHHIFFQQNRGLITGRGAEKKTGIGNIGNKKKVSTEKERHPDYYEGYYHGTKEPEQKHSQFWKYAKLGVLIGLTFALFNGPFVRGLFFQKQFEVNPEEVHVSFDDVRGVDEAMQELTDVVDFLKDPRKFTSLGAKLPKGVLLVGPPGTGKTLLARAVAGEAGVPFFFASGSEFDEVFVGTGAKRVRQLFLSAKLKAPCVIFLDEIDSVGSKRTSTNIHPYANQTINQLLSEMDGFAQNEGIVVIGATNRKDNLDKAILRPGRFDVEVQVNPPDLKGRKEILELYLKKVKISNDINVDEIARGTTGFTGADLENLVNQAALKAALDKSTNVTRKHLDFAKDKILMGPAKKSRLPDEKTNWTTSIHEAGHAVVAYYTKDAFPIHKVTIIPRGRSLGFTSFLPETEMYGATKSEILARMDIAMGGRVGEEMINGSEKVTTGASNDFTQATRLATNMVKMFGMSEKVGVRAFGNNTENTALGSIKVNDVSPALQELVDSEIKRLLQESYDRAKQILKDHSKQHRELAEALMKYETLDKSDVKWIMEGKSLNEKKINEKITTSIRIPKSIA